MLNDLFFGIEVNAFRIIGLNATEATDKALKVNQTLALELLVVGAHLTITGAHLISHWRHRG